VQDGARWFRSTAFGDEKDRVVQRDNGIYTYFASDIAYHLNKFERGFQRIINVWGADHHGYIPRVKGAQRARLDPERLEVALVQFAVLYRSGWKAQMSTRSGDFVTLRTLRARSATTPAASSMSCASPTSTSISTSIWPRASRTTTRSITSSTRTPASARCWPSGGRAEALTALIWPGSTARANWRWRPGSASFPRSSKPPPRAGTAPDRFLSQGSGGRIPQLLQCRTHPGRRSRLIRERASRWPLPSGR
jgi:hypothetical protein